MNVQAPVSRIHKQSTMFPIHMSNIRNNSKPSLPEPIYSSPQKLISSTITVPSATTTPRVKPQRPVSTADKRAIRREQCRANQARYRNKQLKIKRQLRQELQRLEEEIHGLRLKKRSIRFERKTNQSPWTIVSEALRLIEDGFRSPWRLANLDEMMKHSDTRQTLEFLQKSFVHDVRFGDLRGINALMDQWRRYSLYFEDPHLELQQVNVLTAGVFCAAATFSVTITEFTLRCVFPHLIDDEGHGGKVDTAPLQDRLLGERVEFKCSMRFFFDELNGRVVRLEPTVDWIPPLVRLLDGLESVSAVLGTALVSPNCVVGDIP